jgi:hypothetical protein
VQVTIGFDTDIHSAPLYHDAIAEQCEETLAPERKETPRLCSVAIVECEQCPLLRFV